MVSVTGARHMGADTQSRSPASGKLARVGLVPFTYLNGEVSVVLARYPNGTWGISSTRVAEGEDLEEAVRRGCLSRYGLEANVIVPVGSWPPGNLFLAYAPTSLGSDTVSLESIEARWCTLSQFEDAACTLSRLDHQPLERAIALLRQMPRPTTAEARVGEEPAPEEPKADTYYSGPISQSSSAETRGDVEDVSSVEGIGDNMRHQSARSPDALGLEERVTLAVSCYLSIFVWSIAGLVAWVWLLVRAISIHAFSAFFWSLTRRQAPSARRSLREAATFYSDGFRNIRLSIYDKSTDTNEGMEDILFRYPKDFDQAIQLFWQIMVMFLISIIFWSTPLFLISMIL